MNNARKPDAKTLDVDFEGAATRRAARAVARASIQGNKSNFISSEDYREYLKSIPPWQAQDEIGDGISRALGAIVTLDDSMAFARQSHRDLMAQLEMTMNAERRNLANLREMLRELAARKPPE